MPLINKLCIIGVGLIGGSVGKAVKKHGVAGHVCGVVRRKGALDEVIRDGAVDSATLDVADAVKDADLVLIATPVSAIVPTAVGFAPFVKAGCIVTDTGSTKVDVVKGLETVLASRGFVVGGHPISGSEKQGVINGKPDLFDGAPCIITATKNTNGAAITLVSKFWRVLGARIYRMTPEIHDAIFARVSHLPHFVAAAIMNSLGQAEGGPAQLLQYAGSGLKDSTRIAAGSPSLWRDIALSNRKELLKAIRDFENEIKKVRESLEKSDGDALEDILMRARALRSPLV
jgi:prephenate dehydrogenase